MIPRTLICLSRWAVSLSILAYAPVASANLLVNGSFEIGPNPGGSFVTLQCSSTAIQGWTVLCTNVDYIGPYWQHCDGVRSLDLNGNSAGGIAQTFATEIGAQYLVTFCMAGNTDSGPTIKTMRVSAAGDFADFTFNITGYSRPNMGWETMQWSFVASSDVTTLEFSSLVGGSYGPALDNVSVQLAPDGVIYVDDDNCPGPGSGTEGDPFCSIQDAIDASGDSDEIVVAPGTYFETIDFLGKAVTLRSSSDPDVTTIDAQGADTVVTCNSGEGPDTVLDGFTISGGFATEGGGMYAEGADATVLNCTFVDNEASSGGGMYIVAGSPLVSGCTFDSNSADVGAGIGVGVSGATVTDCLFLDNTSVLAGGGIFHSGGGGALIVRCAFIGNTSTGGAGGALATGDSDASVVDCLFVGNAAEFWGGAIVHSASSATLALVNCTISENTTAGTSGGIFVFEDSALIVNNCILWGNSDSGGSGETAQIFAEFTTPVVNFTCVQGLTGDLGGVGNIGADPMFVDPIGADGVPGTEDDDLRLQPNSPCIDAGDNTAVPVDITTDLDGNPRFVDDLGTPNSGFGEPPLVDMGAYEFQGVSVPPPDFEEPIVTDAFGPANREAVGDLDGDGDTDVVIVIPDPDPQQNGYVEVFLNQGNESDDVWLGLMSIGTVEIGREPSAVTVGLLNDDDYLDIAVTNAGDDTVQVLLNDGAVPPSFDAQEPILVGDQPSAIVAEDLNVDTTVDLAVANMADDNVLILANDGQGGFTAGDPIPCGGSDPIGLVAGMIDDEDKDPDLAGANQFSANPGDLGQPGSVFVLLSDGMGGFQPVATYTVGVDPTDLALGDLDRDSQLDIVAVNGADATASLLINQGGGDFAAAPDLPVGTGPLSVEAVDLDGDVDADLAVVAEVVPLGLAVQVFENLSSTVGEVLFGPAQAYDVVDDPQFILSADFNGDGLNDLVTVNIEEGGQDGSVTVLLNDTSVECLAVTGLEVECYGDGTTFTYTIQGNNVCTGGQTTLTFTGSGGAPGEEICFTLLVSDGGFCCSTTLCAVVPDCSPPPVPCDLNGDGVVGLADFLDVLASWGSCGNCQDCPTDFDGNCAVGITDVLMLLANWG